MRLFDLRIVMTYAFSEKCDMESCFYQLRHTCRSGIVVRSTRPYPNRWYRVIQYHINGKKMAEIGGSPDFTL